jgi:hypothetical protein
LAHSKQKFDPLLGKNRANFENLQESKQRRYEPLLDRRKGENQNVTCGSKDMVEEDVKRKAKYCGEQDVAKGDKDLSQVVK